MPNTCKWAKTAITDLKHIKRSIAEDDPRAAASMVHRIVRSTEKQLLSFPGIGRGGRVFGTKELVISPYVVAYRVTHSMNVEILAVMHEAQTWPDHF
jgi:toxin ParE1/3/4